MEVETITMIELSLFITSIIGALVLLLKQLQQSKCNKVSCLCINCERDSSFNDNNDNDNTDNTNTRNADITDIEQNIIRP